jgi:hypothetical protein
MLCQDHIYIVLSGHLREGVLAMHRFALLVTKRLTLVALLLFAVGSVAAVPASPVSAASCSGAGCNNLDPSATGCDSGAITVETQNITQNGSSIRVELRWSSTCQTNWSRVTNTSSGFRYMKAWTQQSGVSGEIYPRYGSGNPGATLWSGMKYAPTGQIYIGAWGFLSTTSSSSYGAAANTGYH